MKDKLLELRNSRFFPVIVGIFIFLFLLILFFVGLTIRQQKIQSAASKSKTESKEYKSKNNNNKDNLLDSTSTDSNMVDGNGNNYYEGISGSSIDSTCIRAVYIVSFYYYKRGNYKEAKQFLEKAITLPFDEITLDTLFYMLSNVYIYFNEFNKAMDMIENYRGDLDLKKIIKYRIRFYRELMKDNEDSLLYILEDFMKDKNYSKSFYKSYLYNLTMAEFIFYAGGDDSLFLSYLSKAMSSNIEKDYKVYLLEGQFFHRKKEYQSAIQAYKKALEYYPFNNIIHSYMGISYYHMEDLDNALKEFKIALSIYPYDYNTWYNIAQIYLYLKRDSLAFDALKKAYMFNQNNYKALYRIGQIYYKYGRYKKAVLVLEKSIDIIKKIKGKYSKNDVKILLLLAESYMHIDPNSYRNKAVDLVIEACLVDPTNNEALDLYERYTGQIFKYSKYYNNLNDSLKN